MQTSIENAYFTRIKQIWRPFEGIASNHGKFIIPFCTTLSIRPPAMVIGTNHSSFAPNKPELATQIAEGYATK